METALTLSSDIFPPLSARGCVQEIKNIATHAYQRTIENKLEVWPQPKKFWTRVSCAERHIPALLSLQPGQVLDIGCIQQIVQKRGDGDRAPVFDRPPVPGSVEGFDQKGELVSLEDARLVWVAYRPLLRMCLTHLAVTTEEWELKHTWSVEAEEI